MVSSDRVGTALTFSFDDSMSAPQIATLPGGSFVLAHTELAYPNALLFLQFFDASGRLIAETTREHAVGLGFQMVSSTTGDVAVVFYDPVYALPIIEIFGASGVSSASPSYLSDVAGGTFDQTELSSTPSGDFVVARLSSNSVLQLFGVTRGGVVTDLSPNEVVSTFAVDSFGSAVLRDGSMVVVYERNSGEVTADDLPVRELAILIYNSAGELTDTEGFTLPQVVVNGEMQTATGFSVTALEGGGFAVGWVTGSGYGNSPQVQVFDRAGTPVGELISLAVASTSWPSAPAIAPLPLGGFVAAWTGDNTGAMQVFDARGSRVSDSFMIDARFVTATSLSSGEFVVLSRVPDDSGIFFELQRFAGERSVIEGSDAADTLQGTSWNDVMLGFSGDDILAGSFGNDTLNGGAGADLMRGGAGDDSYVVDNANDVVMEATGDGNDSVSSSVSFTLANNVENLTLTGSALRATGNALDNRLIGNGAANTLDGRGGADIMRGGLGNDTYYVDNAGDRVIENAGEGTDTVSSSVSITLAANVENLTLTGSGAINGTGNALLNRLVGNSGANILDGGAGADIMRGGLGNDTYYVDNAADKVIELSGQGTDSVFSSITFKLTGNVENLTLTGTAFRATGNTLANVLVGTSGNNVLNGGFGNDVMRGGAGNDTYFVFDSGDAVVEASGEGRDRIDSTVSYTLSANVEDLFLRGSSAINGTGNALDNLVSGNSANNILDGRGGADDLRGGNGADTFAFRDGEFGGTTSSTADRIIDFSQAQGDHIDLSAVDANTLLGGDQAFDFIGTAGFHGVAGELRYQQLGGNTYVYGDTDGDGLADFLIRVDGLHSLVLGDFVI